MSILKKLYGQSKIWFAVAWIVAYCVLMSVGDSLSALIGVEKSVTLLIGALLSIIVHRVSLLSIYKSHKSLKVHDRLKI